MSNIFHKAQTEKSKEREKKHRDVLLKLEELNEKKGRKEITDAEYDELSSRVIHEYIKGVDAHISQMREHVWNFSKEKSEEVFASDGILVLKPFTEEYEDLYIKTRATYAYNSGFYLKPKNRDIVLSELKQEQFLFVAVVRKEDNAYIGYVGLKDTSKNLWEFCIELLPEYCNRGYGYNAVTLFLKKVSHYQR